MLLLSKKLKPENILEANKFFLHTQSVDDGAQDEAYVEIIFPSDENYSNLKGIKSFFDESSENETYNIAHSSDPLTPILIISNLKVDSIGVNLKDDKDTPYCLYVNLISRYKNQEE